MARKMRGPKTAGLNASSIFDALEKLAGILPHVVKHGRGFLGGGATVAAAAAGSHETEVSFQTPASFAVIRNNVTSMSPEQRVDHPEKGVAGIRRVFTQPFNGINLEVDAGPPAVSFFWDESVIAPSKFIDNFTIPINPLILGGPIAAFAQLYDRYVIRRARWRYTTTQTTTFLGTATLCIEKDLGNLVANDFNAARQVTPQVTFPYRVPCAELFYEYDGPELYYVNSKNLGSPVSLLPAEARQDIQFVIKGYDAIIGPTTGPITPATQCGYMDLEIEIDFFDPIPPSGLVGSTQEERLAHQAVRQAFAQQPSNASVLSAAAADAKWVDLAENALRAIKSQYEPVTRKQARKEISAAAASQAFQDEFTPVEMKSLNRTKSLFR